jgi:protein phosphatase 1L
VLASDGLWDAVSNEEAARLALRHRSQGAEAAARALVAEAYIRGSQDNITAVVVFFQFLS